MLYSIKKLRGQEVHGQDGPLGHLQTIFFQEDTWEVRYLVVETGAWLDSRRVLLAVSSTEPLAPDKAVEAQVTRDQVRNSPELNTDMPISQEQQANLHAYYNWPMYWASGEAPTFTHQFLAPEVGVNAIEMAASMAEGTAPEGSLLLHSADEVVGYHVQALDGPAGHVEDILVDEQWRVRGLVVDTRSWRPSQNVVILSEWLDHVSWSAGQVLVHLTREEMEKSPRFEERVLEREEGEGQEVGGKKP